MPPSPADDSRLSTHRIAGSATDPIDNTPPSRAEPVNADTLPPDARVGRYVVRKVLGRGGMGCVYAAWDDDLRRTVAVKVMHPKLTTDAEHRGRFLREARAVAALNHDNVVSIFDVGQADGAVFFAMPHLNGMPLSRFLTDRGPPPMPAVVRIAREVASGLAAAHAVGLLHRDVKPANVFLEAPRGRAKLLDFGLVSRIAGEAALTTPGLVVGTPAYMSPEQARGKPLDPRSDLFSLGAVLYHLCTGRAAFTGADTVSVLAALMTDQPPPAGQFNPQVPPALERLIGRLLSKEVNERPASADEVVSELRVIERELAAGGSNGLAMPAPTPVAPSPAVADDTPVPSATRSRSRRSKATRRRYRSTPLLLAAVASLVLVALLGGFGLALLLVWKNTPPATTAPPTTQEWNGPPPGGPPPGGHGGPPPRRQGGPPPNGPDGRPPPPPPWDKPPPDRPPPRG